MNLDQITIVLHQLHYPENIGAAARAAMNMGIRHLCVVDPADWDEIRALKLATHAAAPLIRRMKHHTTLLEALKPFNYVVGTTARTGRKRPVTSDPRTMARKLSAISHANRVALLFGPEDRGLTNEELRYCHEVVRIPTAGFHSLNVAQAVLILAYECCLAGRNGSDPSRKDVLASTEELERAYTALQPALTRIDFIDARNPDYWMRKLRRTLSRFPLTHRDVNLILGLCRQIETFTRHRRRNPDQQPADNE